MKRILLIVILVFALSSCAKQEETGFRYEEEDFVFEVQQIVDYEQYIYTRHTIVIDDSEVDINTIGEYTLYVTDTNTELEYEIPVIVQDTKAPEIMIPEDFIKYYEVGSVIDLSGIVVIDNSSEEITFTSNVDDIDMDSIGEYSLVITAQDSTGNLIVTSTDIYVRTVVYPVIDIDVYDVSNTSFSVHFHEYDPSRYKVESSYLITQGGEIVEQGAITGNKTIEITDLLQDTEYRVVLYFTFLIPGESQRVMSRSVVVQTVDLFEPMVEIEDVEITTDTLSFLVSVIDPDKLLGDVQITIKDSEGLIVLQRLIGEEPDFDLEQLDLTNEYTVTLRYSYDMADGNGVQEYIDTYTYQILE